jgi:membrane protease YdiL (CAAX protease family)
MMSVKVEAREFALERTIEDLREQKARVEELSGIRTQLASIFTSVVLLITFYTFVLGLFHSSLLAGNGSMGTIREWTSRAIEVVTLLIVIRMIVASRLPLRDFGISLDGWKGAVWESLAVSVAVIVLLAAVKAVVVAHWPGVFREARIVDFGYFGILYVTYIVVAPLQEFITRGTVQSTLERLFVGRSSGFLAIVVTSFLFGALHVYSSIALATAALLTSWLWGWMYHRQKTLVGVSLSHFLIGNAAGLMGYWTFF